MSNPETPQLTRQQIYDRIRESSKDEYILGEMVRLGFWPDNQDAPSLPEILIKQEGELTRELNNLLKKQRRFQDRKKMLREMRKQRLEESKRKQAENKKLREQKREEKARQWKNSKEKDIIFLGQDVSAGLKEKESFPDRLEKNNLPLFADIEDLAKAMDVSVGDLRFLSFSRKISKVSHYKRFYILKKTGGKRLISAPMPKLKRLQHWILENILQNLPLHRAVHGFRQDHSIVSNAEPHLGRDIVVNMDLKDFFPSVTYKRTKGVFRSLGYSEQIATIFGLLCTEPETDEVVLDNETYYAARSERYLPQGAPTSPAVTNIICKRLDARIQGMADKLEFTYTRYADDLTFSCSDQAGQNLTKLIWRTKKIVEDEGFVIHPEKLRIMRKGARQEVTGIVVNEKLNISRRTLNNFRALLYQIEKDGIKGKHWKNSPDLLPSIRGYANYIAMVNKEKGKPLVDRINKILELKP